MNAMNIGVTGSICCGKSSVSRYMGRQLNAPVLNADDICRELLQKGKPGYACVVKCWGHRFLESGGDIDRVQLREAVFNDARIRVELEGILHPLVRIQILEQMEKAKEIKQWLVVEVPLLFEVGWQDIFDITVMVYADPKTCLKRLMVRDNTSRRQGEKILAAQMDAGRKVQVADTVIKNTGSWADTVLQINHLIHTLKHQNNTSVHL